MRENLVGPSQKQHPFMLHRNQSRPLMISELKIRLKSHKSPIPAGFTCVGLQHGEQAAWPSLLASQQQNGGKH